MIPRGITPNRAVSTDTARYVFLRHFERHKDVEDVLRHSFYQSLPVILVSRILRAAERDI